MSAMAQRDVGHLHAELLPITTTQAYLLDTLTDTDCMRPYKHYWTICEGLRIKPGVRPRRLERALKRLVQRHDNLRLAFTYRKGKWVAFQREEDEITLKVEDYGDVSQEQMRKTCDAIVEETMDVTGASLCDFRLLRFGSLGDVVFIRVHHAITDGFGMTVLAEDLIKFFLGLPMQGQVMSHIDYLRDIDAHQAKHTGMIEEYWRDLLFPAPSPIPFGRVQKGMPAELVPGHIKKVINHTVSLPSEEFMRLSEKVTKAGATSFTTLVTTLCGAIQEKTQTDDVIGRTVRARATGTLSNYTGIDLSFPYFRTKISDGKSVIDRAVSLKNQLETSGQYGSRELAKPVNRIEQELRETVGSGPQLFVHIASADGRAGASVFKKLFRAEGGTIIKVGNVEIERMAFRRVPALSVPSELALFVNHSNSNVRLNLRADGDVFDPSELAAIAEPFKETLLTL
ncbi:MAG: condensation domain-containing protein [Sulfitobacter sp.]